MSKKHLRYLFSVLLFAQTGFAQDLQDSLSAPKEKMPFKTNAPAPDHISNPSKLMRDYERALANRMPQPHLDSLKAQYIKAYQNQLNLQTPEIRNNTLAAERRKKFSADRDDAKRDTSRFHITRDINTFSSSSPRLFEGAILNGVMYFGAHDSRNGDRIWRSDGTTAGTYPFKGLGSSPAYLKDAAVINGKLYLASSYFYSAAVWVSDGTDEGTALLTSEDAYEILSPQQLVGLGNSVYFLANTTFHRMPSLWKTDGTAAGTKIIKNIEEDGQQRSDISLYHLTVANGLLFFSTYNNRKSMWELWRSDGSHNGTYVISTGNSYGEPTQLTSYDNQLYFSVGDGADYKLWMSDGTAAGTKPVPGSNDIVIDNNSGGTSFPVINNVMYISGKTNGSNIDALYKYDASDGRGLVKIRDFGTATTFASVATEEMTVIGNTLYFKVTSENGGTHDELWSSKGSNNTTQLEQKFLTGEIISSLYNGSGRLYFVKNSQSQGAELWAAFINPFKTVVYLVKDIFKGVESSEPGSFATFKGKLYFAATDEHKGRELYMTDGIPNSATLVKDINTTWTEDSYAGINELLSIGNEVVFDAYDNANGNELYKSDGTRSGTLLLNDIVPGPKFSYTRYYKYKNNSAYFIAINADGNFSLYRTNGTTAGLFKMTPDFDWPTYDDSWIFYGVADNGTVFFMLENHVTHNDELWSTDSSGKTQLLSTRFYTEAPILCVSGNAVYFVAGNSAYGYELWTSDGSKRGTHMVKDINPGRDNSTPWSLFAYNKEVYFDAYDGVSAGLWKSDGTDKGTIKIKDIQPSGWSSFVFNNMAYFTAWDASGNSGLWKTDGTEAGTQFVQHTGICYDFTDVNGTLFFTTNDGVHGEALWKTDGTPKGTQLVKDLRPESNESYYYLDKLVSCAGKLYFLNTIPESDYPLRYELWTSDGTEEGTVKVDDSFLNQLDVYNIAATTDKLFVAGYLNIYGAELYVGDLDSNARTIPMSKIASEKVVNKTATFNATLYPNPAVSSTQLQITGKVTNVSVTITDMSGRTIWQSNYKGSTIINLPTAKMSPGTYFVTVINGNERKTIKLVKQ